MRETCRACGSGALSVLWKLKDVPYGDKFQTTKALAKSVESKPLTLITCTQCQLLQLAEEVNHAEIYEQYLYTSSVTSSLPGAFQTISKVIGSYLQANSDTLVVDVGANDGTGLGPYRALGCRVVGVEPAQGPADVARRKGIPVVQSFLDDEAVSEVLREHGPADAVLANFVTANVERPADFVSSLSKLLKPNGLISIVTGYHPDQFAINMFEYINHDHLSYFSIGSMKALAEQVGLRLVGTQRLELKGGSIHFLLSQTSGSHQEDGSVSSLLQREKWLRVATADLVRPLKVATEENKTSMQEFLREKSRGPYIGIGASISTTHLLHEFEIGQYFEKLFDDDQGRIGRFSPGFGLEVAPISEISAYSSGATAVILAWQHEFQLVQRLRESGFSGPVVLPLPRFETIVRG